VPHGRTLLIPKLWRWTMFARVASFEGGDMQRLRELNEERQRAGSGFMPDGVRRVQVLNDAPGDRRLFVTFFDSLEQVEAAEAGFESMGGEIPEEVRGRRLSVGVYEVVFDEAV
jgi:hypothetical protein